MEVVATEDVGIGVAVTPWVKPWAHVLRQSLLLTHCSSCFAALVQGKIVPCENNHQNCRFRYFSLQCMLLDKEVHQESKECAFMLGCDVNDSKRETSICLALRFLYRAKQFEFYKKNNTKRMVGLITCFEQRKELLDNVGLRKVDCDAMGVPGNQFRVAFSAVSINAVTVYQNSFEYGRAIYPSTFSWFNHSCIPDVAYNFGFHGSYQNTEADRFLVYPADQNHSNVAKFWDKDFGFFTRGPAVRMRTLRPLVKGKQVCTSYLGIDELFLTATSPKHVRLTLLKTRYYFDCPCTRCAPPPLPLLRIDQILWGNLFPLTTLGSKDFPFDLVHECCVEAENLHDKGEFEDYVEKMKLLYGSLFDFEKKFVGGLDTFQGSRLHPLHLLMVSSYQRSASAFEKLADRKLIQDLQDEAKECLRMMVAFLLLHAGSLYHLFLEESSLLLLLGDALFEVGKKLMVLTNEGFHGMDLGCQHLDLINFKFEEGLSTKCFDSSHKEIWECISRLSGKIWPHLIDGSHFLQSIPNPCDFSWLEYSSLSLVDKNANENEVDDKLYAKLSIHCTIMSAYCGFIVHGPNKFEAHKAFLHEKFDFGGVNARETLRVDVDAFSGSTEHKISTTLARFGSLDSYCALLPKQPSEVQSGRYDYTSGNPTRESLEKLLAKLEYADRAFCFTNGMPALTTVTNLFERGQEIVVCDDIYEGPECFLSQVIPRKGIIVKRVKTSNLDEMTSAIGPKTKLVWLESPTYPLMRISDIEGISSIAHKHGALVLVDNSIMSPVLSQPLIRGADIVLHSPTKFIAGHSDFMAGVLAVKGERLANDIANLQNAQGSGLAPFDCWLCSRGINTMALRVKAQQKNAKKIAVFLSSHERVKKVNYPGLLDHPGRSLHFSQAIGAGSVLSFLTGSPALSKHIVESVKYFSNSFSFGSVKSLIALPYLMCDASIPASERESRGLTEDLISISVGIEDADDLIADLGKALSSGPL